MGRVSLNVLKSLAGEQSFARTRSRGADDMAGFLQGSVQNRAANETWYKRQTGGLGYNASTQHNKRSWYTVLRSTMGFVPYVGPLPPEENAFPRDTVLPLAQLPVSSETKRVLRAVRKLPTLVTRFRKKYLPGSHWSFALVRGLPLEVIEDEEEEVEEGEGNGPTDLNGTGSGAAEATAVVVRVGDLLLTRPEEDDDGDGFELCTCTRSATGRKSNYRVRVYSRLPLGTATDDVDNARLQLSTDEYVLKPCDVVRVLPSDLLQSRPGQTVFLLHVDRALEFKAEVEYFLEADALRLDPTYRGKDHSYCGACLEIVHNNTILMCDECGAQVHQCIIMKIDANFTSSDGEKFFCDGTDYFRSCATSRTRKWRPEPDDRPLGTGHRRKIAKRFDDSLLY